MLSRGRVSPLPPRAPPRQDNTEVDMEEGRSSSGSNPGDEEQQQQLDHGAVHGTGTEMDKAEMFLTRLRALRESMKDERKHKDVASMLLEKRENMMKFKPQKFNALQERIQDAVTYQPPNQLNKAKEALRLQVVGNLKPSTKRRKNLSMEEKERRRREQIQRNADLAEKRWQLAHRGYIYNDSLRCRYCLPHYLDDNHRLDSEILTLLLTKTLRQPNVRRKLMLVTHLITTVQKSGVGLGAIMSTVKLRLSGRDDTSIAETRAMYDSVIERATGGATADRETAIKSDVASKVDNMSQEEVIAYLKTLETIVTSNVATMLTSYAPANQETEEGEPSTAEPAAAQKTGVVAKNKTGQPKMKGKKMAESASTEIINECKPRPRSSKSRLSTITSDDECVLTDDDDSEKSSLASSRTGSVGDNDEGKSDSSKDGSKKQDDKDDEKEDEDSEESEDEDTDEEEKKRQEEIKRKEEEAKKIKAEEKKKKEAEKKKKEEEKKKKEKQKKKQKEEKKKKEEEKKKKEEKKKEEEKKKKEAEKKKDKEAEEDDSDEDESDEAEEEAAKT